MTDLTLNRRDAVASLLAISATGALAACSKSDGGSAKKKTGNDLLFAKEGQFFGGEEMALIAALAETIIPKTDTAGAIEAGVPQTLQGLASEWGDDNFRAYWRSGLRDLGAVMRKAGGQAFDKMPTKVQETALAGYDAKVYNGEIENGFYRDFKRTVATAYYMSEPGATEELSYEAVPGDWIGCVPVEDYPKTWAT